MFCVGTQERAAERHGKDQHALVALSLHVRLSAVQQAGQQEVGLTDMLLDEIGTKQQGHWKPTADMIQAKATGST